ncbi:MAG: O-antigen ligase family protein [Patescibacteria group bacterium]
MKKLYGEAILLPIIICGLFIITFLPLYVSGIFYFPYIAGKGFAFRLIVEIITAGWLVLAVQSPKYRPQRSFILLAAAIFIIVLGLATLLGENPYRSFWSNFERMEGLIAHLHLFFYFVVAISVLKTKVIWHRIFVANVLASIVVGGYGLLQLAGKLPIMQGGVRLDSTLGNAAYLGTYMFFLFFITLYLLLADWSHKNWRYFYLGAMLLQIFVLYETATRGAILGFIFSLLVVAGLGAWAGRKNILVRNIALGTLAGLTLLVGGVWFARDSAFISGNPVLARFVSISLTEGTVKSRLMIWNISWQGVKERPILGWGQDNFSFVFTKYYNPQMYAQEPWFDRSHNVFLDWLVAAGVVGLIAYLYLFFSATYALVRDKKKIFSSTERIILLALLGGYFLQNLVIFDNLISYVLFFSLIAYIHVRSAEGNKNIIELVLDRESMAKYTPAVGVMAVVLFGLISFFVVVRPVLASASLINALRAMGQGNIKIATESFAQVYRYHTFADREASEQATSAVTSAIVYRNPDTANIAKLSTVAEAGVKKQLAAAPNDVRMRIFYSELLQLTNRPQEALAELELARTYSPKKQDILYRLAFFAASNGDLKKALVYARESYDLLPVNDQAVKMYGLLAIQTGDRALAEKILLPRFGTLAVNDDNFINYYSKIKRYDLVTEIWGQRTKNNPNDTNAWTKYAMSLYALGQRTKSISVLEEAIVLNPAFKTEAEKLIKIIKEGRAEVG